MDDRHSQPNEAFPVDGSRRDFLKFCSMVGAAIGLGPGMGSKVAAALTAANRPKIIWLHFAECTGCTESALRVQNSIKNLQLLDTKAKEIEKQSKYTRHTYFDDMPGLSGMSIDSFDDLIMNTVSLDYHETLMAGAGATVHDDLFQTAEANKGNFICVVEGAIPGPFEGNSNDGYFGTIGGRTMLSIAKEVCPKAKWIIALGTCSSFGGIQYAKPNPSKAKNITAALQGLVNPPQVINVPGCPPNPIALVGTIVYLLVKGAPPGTDEFLRPNFAYGINIHFRCPYYPQTEDESPKTQCLRIKGCKGPQTYNVCPSIQFNNGANFPMQARHICIGCSEPDFWDKKTPFWKMQGRYADSVDAKDIFFDPPPAPVTDPRAAVLPHSKTLHTQENIKNTQVKTFNALGRQVKTSVKNTSGKIQKQRRVGGMFFEKTKDNVKKALEF
jgi:[NiFe] hydrogenase small subunit